MIEYFLQLIPTFILFGCFCYMAYQNHKLHRENLSLKNELVEMHIKLFFKKKTGITIDHGNVVSFKKERK